MASAKKSFLIVLLAASLVFFSGCIELGGGGEEKTAKGLEITSFESIPSEVFSGDSFDLLLDVKNIGGVTANDVKAELIQRGGASTSEGFGSTVYLDPPSQDFEGEKHTFEAKMEAPSISVGPENLNIKSRVYYKYSTEGRVLLPVMMKDEYKTRVQAGDEIPGMGVSTISKGPFSISIDGASPTLLEEECTGDIKCDDEEKGKCKDAGCSWDSSKSDDEKCYPDGAECISLNENECGNNTGCTWDSGAKKFRFYIKGKNTGNGVPYHVEGHPNPTSDDLHEINVDVDLGDGAKWASGGNCSGETTVRGGDDFQVICEGKYKGEQDFAEIPIDVELDYGYYITGQTSVKVKEEI